jgi:subtilisin family serine protease
MASCIYRKEAFVMRVIISEKGYMRNYLALSMALLLSLPIHLFPFSAQAQTLKQLQASKKPKLAPDLEEILAQDDQQSLTLGQLRQNRLTVKSNPQKKAQPLRLNQLTLPSADVAAEEKQSFIVQMERATPDIVWQEKLARLGARISGKVEQTGLVMIEAPRTAIRQLAADNNVAYVSPDRLMSATTSGYVERVSGRDAMRQISGCDKIMGADMNVAVLDSGVWTGHHNVEKQMLLSVDFTGERNTTSDPFGHGTHVASLAAGLPHVSKGAYEGLAPGARIVSLRVLDAQGRGSVTWALNAINWLASNATKYKIRVVNMSFGTAAVDSYLNDPLCRAVRRLVNAGLVVVVSAGNNGKDSSGKKIYGRISSPGNEPSAITVGAANTMGTETRGDDRVATFSSRGPTRSSYVDANGIRHYDNLIKPDLVAAGNKLVAAAADNNFMLRNYPNMNARVADDAKHNQMVMSGTSMSAPVVAGAASLILQANPTLTPNLVKAVLMYTAQPLKGFNMLEQGAGLLNVAGAVQLAKLIRTDLTSSTARGTTMLKAALPNPQANVINGETCYWGQAVIADHTFFYGSALMTKWSGIYRLGTLLGDGTILGDGIILGDRTFMADGVQIAEGPMTMGSGVVFADGTLFAKGVVFADGTLLSDGVILGDGTLLGDGTILGDGVLLGDQIRGLTILANGDDTPGMPVIADDGSVID